MPAKNPSPALFFETVSAFERTEALRAAIELDLFTQVGAGHHSAEQIAIVCGASPRGIRILADYLTILGFLAKHNDTYELTHDSAVFLNRTSPAYVGGVLDFILTPQLRESTAPRPGCRCGARPIRDHDRATLSKKPYYGTGLVECVGCGGGKCQAQRRGRSSCSLTRQCL